MNGLSLAFVANALIGGLVTVYTKSDAKLTGVLTAVDDDFQ
jgi:small nuclear ribonucleoprotein (snRNP)-like protein